MMSDTKPRPMIFRTDSIRPMLDGRKTQTRRVVKDQPLAKKVTFGCIGGQGFGFIFGNANHVVRCPYGKPGDTFYWASEPIEFVRVGPNDAIRRSLYDHCDRLVPIPKRIKRPSLGRWRGRILPIEWARSWRWEITEVRVQRLQDISEEDAIAEAVVDYITSEPAPTVHRRSFKGLWNTINARRGHGWDLNEWVWALTFRRIDTVKLSRVEHT